MHNAPHHLPHEVTGGCSLLINIDQKTSDAPLSLDTALKWSCPCSFHYLSLNQLVSLLRTIDPAACHAESIGMKYVRRALYFLKPDGTTKKI
jgi:hypothetical protein